MTTLGILLLSGLVLVIAAVYSSVGQGGASAYLAVMALCGLNPSIMKPTALILNIIVSGIAAISFHRAGAFSWRAFWPFALGSIPFSFIGSTFRVSHLIYKLIVGVILLIAGGWMLFKKTPKHPVVKQGNQFIQILIGGAIGLVAGVTGMGGRYHFKSGTAPQTMGGTPEDFGYSSYFYLC